MKPLLVAVAVAALSFLTFFQFPGHTWLQQDSQIYVPILEHLRDPAVLRNEVLVQRPHVTFTLYDEAALFLRRVTGLGFREVLGAEQILCRAFGIWGLYLIATSAGVGSGAALLIASIVSLGATVLGPSVLTFEYEPIPRGFAVPLLICAVGLLAHSRYLGAGLAATAGFLIHPPTVAPFWALYFILAEWPSQPERMRRRLYGLLTLLGGVIVLAVASRLQPGVAESQLFFSTLTPLQEKLQRWRTAYIWISIWGTGAVIHYLAMVAILTGAYVRVRQRLPFELRFFLLGLALIGLLSVPVSWVLLEQMRWALMPQIQPLRALLFVTLAMQVMAALAGVTAGAGRRYVEAFAWFLAAYVIPLQTRIDAVPSGARAAALLLLAALATAAMWLRGRPGAWAVAALAGFWIVPVVGGVVNYPQLHTPEIAELSEWARASTPSDAIFLFPDVPMRSLDASIFRSKALRAVYVDWKGGGQVNYLKELGEQWWNRWQETLGRGFQPADLPRYRSLGIEYVVLQPNNRLDWRAPDFANSRYLAYRLE